MKRNLATILALILVVSGCPVRALAGDTEPPVTMVYRQAGDRALHAYVFFPPEREEDDEANAILLFHGGGWSVGTPEWTFSAARRFADFGLVAVAIEYRLSNEDITPIDALEDACAAFEWVRGRSAEFGLTGKVAGYGVSAGGHLVAATATIGCSGGDVGPDALLLWSAALDPVHDGWFEKLLQGRASTTELSPARNVRATTPPTCIVQGEMDTLTPLAGARRYCAELTELGGECQLNVFSGLGHLLTTNLANQESDFDPDPKAVADGIAKQLQFLQSIGFAAADLEK